MIAALKLVGAPGSLGFVALCCGIGLCVIHVWPRRPILGRIWLFVVFCAYAIFGTPVVAHEIADSLSSYHPVVELTNVAPSDTVVIFGGDNVRGRVRETLRACAAWPRARVIIFGDDWILDQLLEAGIPAGRIVHDPRPANTFEQMAAVREYLATHEGKATAVVASRLQMPRVAALANAMRLPVRLLPSPIDVEPPRTGLGRLLPRYTALRITRDAIYEYAALAYYRWKGLTVVSLDGSASVVR